MEELGSPNLPNSILKKYKTEKFDCIGALVMGMTKNQWQQTSKDHLIERGSKDPHQEPAELHDRSKCQAFVDLILLIHLVIHTYVYNIIYHVCNMMIKTKMFLCCLQSS